MVEASPNEKQKKEATESYRNVKAWLDCLEKIQRKERCDDR